MRILIENYNDLYSTEPLYLLNSFKIAQCEAALWDTNVYSAYDALDSTKPDILVLKWNSPQMKDILNYVLSNDKSPDLIVNATGAPETIIKQLKQFTKCKMAFTNRLDESLRHGIELIFPAVDPFIPSQPLPDFYLEAAVISEEPTSFGEQFETYHNLYFGNEKVDWADINTNLSSLVSLYPKYEAIFIAGEPSLMFSQIFFDAVARSKRVMLKYKDEDAVLVQSFLAKVFDMEEKNKTLNIEHELLQHVKLNHTSFNRAQQLLKEIGCIDEANKLDVQINNIAKNGNNTKTI